MFVSFINRSNTQLLVSDLLMVGGQTHTHTHKLTPRNVCHCYYVIHACIILYYI